MRGCIVKRKTKNCYALVLSERRTDPATGRKKLWQKWVSFRGKREQAETKMAELVAAYGKGEFVEPSKLTVGKWLSAWLEETIKPSKRPSTYDRYKGIITDHITPVLGDIRLQALRPGQLEAYYAGKRKAIGQNGEKQRPLSGSTLALHHTVLFSSLKKAWKNDLVSRNVASLVEGTPRPQQRKHEDVLAGCWTAEEAQRLIAAAKLASPQEAAFYTLAIETGARKGELCGLKWSDMDLEGETVKVLRTLLKPKDENGQPVFGPTKTGAPRTIDLSDESVKLLRAHRRTQAELKLKNRAQYHDHGLVFAKQWSDMGRKHDVLGDALQLNNLGQRSFAKLIAAAKVRVIRFHDLRHTCATLLLQAGVPAKVVQERLGHKKIEITLNIYAHVLPSMQQDAAARIAAVLHR